jgi:3-isopropylmalate dehydrogenase
MPSEANPSMPSEAPTVAPGSRPFQLAVIGGDGIGPEVVAEGLKVLDAVTGPDTFSITPYDLGASRWQRTGEVLPDSVLDELAQAT